MNCSVPDRRVPSVSNLGSLPGRKGIDDEAEEIRRIRGIRHELATIVRQSREVWRLIPWRHRLSLAGAVGIMSLASAANTAIALCMGNLINVVNPQTNPTSRWPHLTQVAADLSGRHRWRLPRA